MSYFYKTVWSGEKLNLGELNDEQKNLLRECFELFEQRCNYPKFFSQIHSNENLKIMGAEYWNGQYWINAHLHESSVIYKVLEDMADILGMEQGFIAKEEIDFTQNEEALKFFLAS